VCKQVLKHISILAIALWRKTFWFTGVGVFALAARAGGDGGVEI
jgi:hypothetical protein